MSTSDGESRCTNADISAKSERGKNVCAGSQRDESCVRWHPQWRRLHPVVVTFLTCNWKFDLAIVEHTSPFLLADHTSQWIHLVSRRPHSWIPVWHLGSNVFYSKSKGEGHKGLVFAITTQPSVFRTSADVVVPLWARIHFTTYAERGECLNREVHWTLPACIRSPGLSNLRHLEYKHRHILGSTSSYHRLPQPPGSLKQCCARNSEPREEPWGC